MRTLAGRFKHLVQRSASSLYRAIADLVSRRTHLNVYDPKSFMDSHQFSFASRQT